MQIISKTVSSGQQSVEYSETLNADGIKLRISIKSDSYDFQSHARIEVFNPTDLKWNPLASIHYASMVTPPKLIYRPNQGGLSQSNFAADRENLLRQAALLLDISTEPSTGGPRR